MVYARREEHIYELCWAHVHGFFCARISSTYFRRSGVCHLFETTNIGSFRTIYSTWPFL